jgi:ribonuclease HI
MNRVSVHTDGAARGNPGPASIAYVIRSGDDLIEYSEAIGQTTNNQAEYRAMLAACRALEEKLPIDAIITFHSDSELMVKQLRGEYKVKDANIRPHFEAIAAILTKLEQQGNTVELLAVRREYNKRADELANIALDART